MFPSGNIVLESSKFRENVPDRRLLARSKNVSHRRAVRLPEGDLPVEALNDFLLFSCLAFITGVVIAAATLIN